ncbi:dimethylamine monooxygenase subunit DmmA family protein [Pseudoclavibacter sp. VKM Ac-2867]|uniref:dimethylamine monooxygenase subunit DmmA family protein n=1 Tax=Pseudoclavibacter sp. VKM Ac-2867 TaxID=2783829 RepID=UPI00188AA224|nr:dimethylamine monooxygenase subunit DmmA family protein [Pseudoclavibacter sp. VKM Ac-2867]MBF4459084.1 hypothetical protein [Pseudoclavibacter sp. VKM Ac-2867]
MEPVAGAEAVTTEVAPGVSLAATSSARWRRLLAAGSSRDADPDLGEDARARRITFLVDKAGDARARARARAGAGARADPAADRHPESDADGDADTGTRRAGDLDDASRSIAGIVVVLGDVASPASRARIDAGLARARTGWRFRVGGDEAAVGALRAILHEAGVLDEEIEFVLAPPGQSDAQVTVYCGHCHAKTRTTAPHARGPANSAQPSEPSELVSCGGCGIALTVYHHYSRRQGAYLGYFAGAEQEPAEQGRTEQDPGQQIPAGQGPAEHPSAGRRPVTRERSELALA